MLLALGLPAPARAQSWPSAGRTPADSRDQPELAINPLTAHGLAPKWVFTTRGDVSATPTVAGGVVYVPDWGGYLSAVNASLADGRAAVGGAWTALDPLTGAIECWEPPKSGARLVLASKQLFRPGGQWPVHPRCSTPTPPSVCVWRSAGCRASCAPPRPAPPRG
ncbi:MAG: PQQ-binding-like beta-propeller repeat protein [Solirubrobacteraceae bacterium]